MIGGLGEDWDEGRKGNVEEKPERQSLNRPNGEAGGQAQCKGQVEKSQWGCLLLPTPGPASQGLQSSRLEGPINWARGNQEKYQELQVRPNPE